LKSVFSNRKKNGTFFKMHNFKGQNTILSKHLTALFKIENPNGPNPHSVKPPLVLIA